MKTALRPYQLAVIAAIRAKPAQTFVMRMGSGKAGALVSVEHTALVATLRSPWSAL